MSSPFSTVTRFASSELVILIRAEMTADGMVIRPSRESDVPEIAAIYGYHVLHGLSSFEEVPPHPDELASRRRNILARGLPYLVAERSGRVLGYCYAGPYRTRSAYRFTVEDSIYIDKAEAGRGLGRALLAAVLDRCAELGYRQMVAVIGGSDTWPSIRLHAALGFTRIGVLPAVGFKFGGWVDIVLMQRALGPGETAAPAEISSINRGEDHE
jgi:L-amino acid N-acyltransferase YncA